MFEKNLVTKIGFSGFIKSIHGTFLNFCMKLQLHERLKIDFNDFFGKKFF